MADPSDIEYVMELVNEVDDSNGWTAERVAAYIDREGSNYLAASAIWTVKAGEFSTAVDVSESGSSRKLSDLKKNALDMAAHYRKLGTPEEVAVDRLDTAPFSVPIVRARRGRV